MKKVFLNAFTLIFATTVFVSCQSDGKSKSSDTLSNGDSAKAASKPIDTTPVVQPSKAEIQNSKVGAPSFSDPEVNNGFKEFDSIKAEYETALAKKDEAGIKAAKDKFNAWALKASTWGTRFSDDENLRYIAYYEKIVSQWDILTRQSNKK